jgi:hypothetical protein
MVKHKIAPLTTLFDFISATANIGITVSAKVYLENQDDVIFGYVNVTVLTSNEFRLTMFRYVDENGTSTSLENKISDDMLYDDLVAKKDGGVWRVDGWNYSLTKNALIVLRIG